MARRLGLGERERDRDFCCQLFLPDFDLERDLWELPPLLPPLLVGCTAEMAPDRKSVV